ncbi:hypothetical protein Tcan_11089 [Toxocara canis]|uniref:Uncharacterized protein n=1 Tax=Toxocara canis TaxID=6265 RepID=A0A0B2VUL4_TOXCA|nr:hypothetical protein Tcan_11089 [Toxocara canis]
MDCESVIKSAEDDEDECFAYQILCFRLLERPEPSSSSIHLYASRTQPQTTENSRASARGPLIQNDFLGEVLLDARHISIKISLNRAAKLRCNVPQLDIALR